jgi:hypothetical protein
MRSVTRIHVTEISRRYPIPQTIPENPRAEEFRAIMRSVIRIHVTEISRKYPIPPTTLSLEELLDIGNGGVSRPQNAFILYRKDIRGWQKTKAKNASLEWRRQFRIVTLGF